MQLPTPALLTDVLLFVHAMTKDGKPYDFNYQDCRRYTSHPFFPDVRECFLECIQYELLKTGAPKGFAPATVPPVLGLSDEGFLFLGFLHNKEVYRQPEMQPAKAPGTLFPYYHYWTQVDDLHSVVLDQALLTCIKEAKWGKKLFIDPQSRANTPLADYRLSEIINSFELCQTKEFILGGKLEMFPRPTIGLVRITESGEAELRQLESFFGKCRRP